MCIKRKKHYSIRTIFLAAFVGLVVLPFVALIAISYRVYSGHAMERHTSFLMQSLSFAQSQMDALVSGYNDVSLAIYHDTTVELLNNELSPSEREIVAQSLNSIRISQSDIAAVYLEHNGVVYHVGVEFRDFMTIVEPYRAQVVEEQGFPIWTVARLYPRRGTQNFIIARSLNSSTQRNVGILYLVLDSRGVEEIFTKTNFGWGEVYLLNSHEIIFSLNEHRIGSYFEPALEEMPIMRGYITREIDGVNSLITFHESFRTGWVMTAQTPTSAILEYFLPIRNTIIIVALVYALFLLVMMFLLHRLVFNPINRLIMNMDEVAAGNLHKKAKETTSGELQRLNIHFNNMTDKLNSLVASRGEQEKIKTRLKVQALIAQLNPHFIYNSLNTIKWLAVINKQKNIQDLTDSLSRVLMTTTKDESDSWTLGKEIELIKNYINIQRYRFMDFDVFYFVEDEANACLISKFLIQPLVENAIVHGISKKKKGIIRIHAWLDDELHIRIEDNGVGFNIENLGELKSETLEGDVHTKIGLHNISQIIEHEYGGEYGIRLESELGKGTLVECILPIQWEG